MLQEFVDNLLAVTKESVKTFTYESLNNIARLINGVSALLLALLPGKSNILEGASGWELRPTLRGPRLPRWMENGVSSFNEFIHELSFDSSDAESISEYSTHGDDEHEDPMAPPSPLSTSSRISRTSSFSKYDRRLVRFVRYILSWMLWPITLLLWSPLVLLQLFRPRPGRTGTSAAVGRKTVLVKEHVVQRATDRRRGVFEDLQLAIEMFIESVFEMVQKVAHFILSPTEAGNKVYSWLYPHANGNDEGSDSDTDIPIQTATIGSENPIPTQRQISYPHYLNTDSRTCEDVIAELGYPYEKIKVVTSDGYILLLERLPRRDSQKVVFLQHGILDSSMGWVSNGVVGSPAFAAYDQGYDVFLGNLRGLVSREHVDKNISSRKYWRYSINEHGTRDMPAIIEKIHEIKTSELSKTPPACPRDDLPPDQPYKLSAICHSLGGAVILMYVVMQRISNLPHRLSRLILLSPAGFHEDLPLVFTVAEKFMVLLGPILAPLFPGLYIPTRFFRMLLNKLARDFHNYPGLGGLVQTLMGYAVGGDSSNWLGAIGLPHYNMYDMPGVSFHVALHLAQIKRSKKFRMYDYGRASTNIEAYGSAEPLDIGANYHLIDIPVDLVAGKRDRIVPPSMVRKHYRLIRKGGVAVSYNEFEYAHLDFTFSHREELLAYVMSRLMMEKGNSVKETSVRLRKLKKKGEMVAEGEITAAS
ncbi:hypothetical protein LUZ63_014773 [Rhynchospora breviuscula]|uniref:Partial AB-hydrolase lipase domain-containing protein n=1 Tax=Rhynchospora breviuscula TaxID=2022672 RepID=A0A9Q0CB32_9POAL|nr:hypothetical protein LUZ63_014773 [Rhynchospora breviuscula]